MSHKPLFVCLCILIILVLVVGGVEGTYLLKARNEPTSYVSFFKDAFVEEIQWDDTIQRNVMTICPASTDTDFPDSAIRIPVGTEQDYDAAKKALSVDMSDSLMQDPERLKQLQLNHKYDAISWFVTYKPGEFGDVKFGEMDMETILQKFSDYDWVCAHVRVFDFTDMK